MLNLRSRVYQKQWVSCQNFRYSGIIIDGEDINEKTKDNYNWIYWIGDGRLSEVFPNVYHVYISFELKIQKLIFSQLKKDTNHLKPFHEKLHVLCNFLFREKLNKWGKKSQDRKNQEKGRIYVGVIDVS